MTSLATRAADRRAAHTALPASSCAVAYLNHLAVIVAPGESIADKDLYAVQVGYCEHHDVSFTELHRGNDLAEAERVIAEHNEGR